MIGVDAAATPLIGAGLTFDGLDATASLSACFLPGALKRGGTTFNCQVPRGLTEGDHVLQVVLTFADQTTRRNAVRWSVVGASER